MLLLAVSYAAAVSGWVVDSDLHGCNMSRRDVMPGWCAGTITVQSHAPDGELRYDTLVVPFTTPIYGEDGNVTTLPHDGWVDAEVRTQDNGLDLAVSVRKSRRTGGPARFRDRRSGIDAASMSTDQLKDFINTGFLKSHAAAARQLIARGESAALRKHLNGSDRLRRVAMVWALSELLDPAFASDMEARLADSEPYARAEAVYYFKALKRADVADKIAPLFQDSYSGARGLAADYMGELKVAKYKPQLEALKQDKEEHVRKSAEKALAALKD